MIQVCLCVFYLELKIKTKAIKNRVYFIETNVEKFQNELKRTDRIIYENIFVRNKNKKMRAAFVKSVD